ncbi:MAG: phosphate/phosphite/phosphonate ABC transporter substrate-binding protein [Candidatus Electronema sp. V4]|uniref:phosphate/phosphite/phosphonate ABC transporter substrate-binding protein n=1 Tax=Candidatus Electronema sp. V4 TaxID=3454756 RepID=UPI00405599B0
MKNIIFALLAVLLCAAPPLLAGAEEHLLSMQPSEPPERQAAMLAPLAEKLSAVFGAPVRTVLLQNAAEYEAELLRGGITVGYQSPLTYVRASDRHEVLVTAAQSKSGSQQRGIIIVRPDAGISKIEKLRGKKVMVVSRNSAGGFLSQKQSLREQGLEPGRDFQLLEAAAGREENVIIAVSLGDADAGFISEGTLHKADRFIVPGSVAELMKTAPLPGWALSVSRELPQEQKESLRSMLTQLAEDDPALRALGITAFQAAADADYDAVRNLTD